MKKIQSLDGLRATSILLVMAAHMLPLGPKQLQLNAAAAGMGMSLFFSLSGFLITTTLLNGLPAQAFFVRRLARILPLAYGYLSIAYLALSFEPSKLLAGLVFVENYMQVYLDDLNGHFWSLCVEVHFYLFIGGMVTLFGQRSIGVVIPACIAVTVLRISSGAIIDIRTHLRVDEILAGATVAILFFRKKADFQLPSWSLLVVALAWFVTSWPLAGAAQYIRPYGAAALMATVLWLEPCRFTVILSSRIGRYIAEISYALYVFHPLTIHGWMNDGTTWERYLFKRPVSFVAAFSVAHLSTFYWERTWIVWAHTVTGKRLKKAETQ